MGKTVTFVEADPGIGQATQPPGDGNQFLDTMEAQKKLAGATRVTSLKALGIELAALGQGVMPDVIQIIGHGCPGMVSLGYHFTGAATVPGSTEYFLLDANPYEYSLLRQLKPRPETQVWLLGCFVGSTDLSTWGSVANGPTLLFDLREMWGCSVYAPTDAILPTDFDDSGCYLGELVDYAGHAPPGRVAAASTLTVTAPAASAHVLELDGTMATPYLGRHGEGGIPLDGATRNLLGQSFTREVTLPPGLPSLPEASFGARLDGRPAQASLISGGRFLAVRAGETTRYFAADERTGGARQELRQLLDAVRAAPADYAAAARSRRQKSSARSGSVR